MNGFDFPIQRVTCHTPGCANEGIPIELPCAGAVQCGPCGQVIADVADPPEPPESTEPAEQTESEET